MKTRTSKKDSFVKADKKEEVSSKSIKADISSKKSKSLINKSKNNGDIDKVQRKNECVNKSISKSKLVESKHLSTTVESKLGIQKKQIETSKRNGKKSLRSNNISFEDIEKMIFEDNNESSSSTSNSSKPAKGKISKENETKKFVKIPWVDDNVSVKFIKEPFNIQTHKYMQAEPMSKHSVAKSIESKTDSKEKIEKNYTPNTTASKKSSNVTQKSSNKRQSSFTDEQTELFKNSKKLKKIDNDNSNNSSKNRSSKSRKRADVDTKTNSCVSAKKVSNRLSKDSGFSDEDFQVNEPTINIKNEAVSTQPFPDTKTKIKTKKRKTSLNSSFKASGKIKKSKSNLPPVMDESASELSDWEDVDEFAEILKSGEDLQNSKDGVKIEFETDDFWTMKRKRKRRTYEDIIEDYLRRQINNTIRKCALNAHKTHVLCLLAHGMHLNSVICHEDILTSARSLLPQKYYSPKRVDIDHLEKFLAWFCKTVTLTYTDNEEYPSFLDMIKNRFEKKSARNNKELIVMFVAIARAAGMIVRLVQNLLALSWKPDSSLLIKPNQPSNECDTKEGETTQAVNTSKAKTPVASSSNSPKPVSEESDDDFVASKPSRSKSVKKKSNNNSAEKKKKQKDVFNDWVEVFVEEEEMWVSVDVKRNKYHCTQEIEARCSNLSYIVAFNEDQTVKDVTKRYVSNWLSVKNKIQCDEDWWNNSLTPFTRKQDPRQAKEDKQMEEKLEKQPLPKSIAEYKNHPLYALRRHLLKFEAIYPPDIEPLGVIKSESIYPRSSITTLRSRDVWYREAKCVRVGEKPYNIVKARPKWDRNLCEIVKDRSLEVFGEWQLEDYEPPIAVNGKVPRNEYGNVDLFKPCMLPRGCVHLPINGLTRLARKLSIDCAVAVVGFEYQRGGSFPVTDGFVVCEEFKDILLDAWNEEQVENEKKEETKRLERIYSNWKKLIKGMVLKDRLKEKYGFVKEINNPAATQKKKIKQDDLDKLASSVVHSVVPLKIDRNTCVMTKICKRGEQKKSRNRTNKREKSKSNVTNKLPKHEEKNEPISTESDSDEMDVEEKQEKIRTILQWNPTKFQSDELALSDFSDTEEMSASSFTEETDTKISDTSFKSSQTSSRAGKRKSYKIKKKVAKNESDSETEPIERTTRHSARRRTQMKYAESDATHSDISIKESDTEDKTFNPNADLKDRKKTLFSDSDSD